MEWPQGLCDFVSMNPDPFSQKWNLPGYQVLELLDLPMGLRMLLQVSVCEESLLIIGKASHDSRIHNAIQEHGQRVDRQAWVIQVLLDHAANLVIGQLHRLDGILQWTDLYHEDRFDFKPP